jgi:hypothetical protein
VRRRIRAEFCDLRVIDHILHLVDLKERDVNYQRVQMTWKYALAANEVTHLFDPSEDGLE